MFRFISPVASQANARRTTGLASVESVRTNRMADDHLSSEKRPRTTTTIASKRGLSKETTKRGRRRRRRKRRRRRRRRRRRKRRNSHLPYLAWQSDISIVDVEVGTC